MPTVIGVPTVAPLVGTPAVAAGATRTDAPSVMIAAAATLNTLLFMGFCLSALIGGGCRVAYGAAEIVVVRVPV
jgi:hypothetical protein